MSKKLLILAILALLATSGIALAQNVPQGRIEGKISDNQGAPLPGVSIVATSPSMVGKAAAVTAADGTYRLFNLPSGLYEVTFTLQGFKTLIRKEIVVQLSQTITLNASLEQAAVEEQITVTGMSPLIDVKSTIKSQTMTKEVFLTLPRSRNFDGLLSTAPGVQYDTNTGGLSVDGASGGENMWYMDGSDITQMHRGYLSQSAVMEFIEEVKVTASGYNAEFGGSMGGVVNVITRSGGNAFHGDIIGYYNDNSRLMQGKARQYSRWNPYNDYQYQFVNDDDVYFNGGYDRDPYKRYEGVFNLGGYILKDRLWFFGSFNPQYSNQGAMRGFLVPGSDPPTIGPLDKYNQRWSVWNGQAKLTAAPIKGLRLSASFVNNYSRYRGAIPSIDGTGSTSAPYGNYGQTYPNVSYAGTADYSLGNNLLISARAGYHMTNTIDQRVKNGFTTWYFNASNQAYASDPFFVTNSDLLGYTGTANYAGDWRDSTQRYKLMKTTANLDATYYLNFGGEHAIKGGVQLIRDHEDVWSFTAAAPHVNLMWGLSCANLAPYGVPTFTGTYGYYTIRNSFTSPYGYFWNAHRNTWALYLQDSWTVMGKLTINYGLRAEAEYIPAFSNDTSVPGYRSKPLDWNFGNKLAPRLGLVYDVFGDSSLKIFGSFGIYYDVMKLYVAEGDFGGFKWKTDYYTLDNPDFRQIAANGIVSGDEGRISQGAGGTYMGTIDFRMPSWDKDDPNMKPVCQREISVGAEKRLTENVSLSVRGIYKHLIRTIEDIGFISVEPGNQGELYYLSNPGSAYINNVLNQLQGPGYWPEPKAKREYYGLNISLEKRFSHNWMGGINYTLSRVKGNYGGLSSTDEGGRSGANTERYFDFWYMAYTMNGTPLDGPLPQDRTHYIKAYGSYVFPFGLTVGVVGYARSGLPLSTRLQLNSTYMYPLGYGDLGRMPFTFWADLYAEYAFKIASKYTLAVNLQFNNITNTKTWQNYNIDTTRDTMDVSFADILSKTFDWRAAQPGIRQNGLFGMPASQFGTWSTRLGIRFTF